MRLNQSLDHAELTQLARTWGAAPLEQHSLTVDHPFLTGNHQLLTRDDRRAEICYVMHRSHPAAGVLLHIKTFYPDGAYRLPTGGIHMGEGVEETLAREIEEETGLRVGSGAGDARVERFLGVTAYEMRHVGLGETQEFATYHFLVRMPPAAKLEPQDETESIAGWCWCVAGDLSAVAARLERVGQRRSDWADWGRFRALSHQFVAAALQSLDDGRGIRE